MIELTINGKKVQSEGGSTILQAALSNGIDIPTLCFHEDLTPYGVCRLCTVEIEEHGRKRLVASCLYPAKEGLKVETNATRVVNGRRMILGLLLARCPDSKILQEMAQEAGLQKTRFKQRNDDCILCGLCVRMCEEVMKSEFVGFIGRGRTREAVTPFRASSDFCLNCGACKYICPVRALEMQED